MEHELVSTYDDEPKLTRMKEIMEALSEEPPVGDWGRCIDEDIIRPTFNFTYYHDKIEQKLAYHLLE